MNENGLYEFWNEFINRDIYRVTSEEYLLDMTKHGLNPSNDPFSKMYEEIEKLFEIIVKYEKKGIIYQEEWRDG
ncbi:MAG: hypothetical protein KJ574_02505, partial [Nanoarchaeota archaeon]|nr:hypothetical protein [Nanoarchaeota archaeon]